MCINITIRGPVFSSSSFHFLPLYPPLLFTVLFCTHFLNLFSSLSFLITRTMKEANVWKRPTRHAQDGYFVKGIFGEIDGLKCMPTETIMLVDIRLLAALAYEPQSLSIPQASSIETNARQRETRRKSTNPLKHAYTEREGRYTILCLRTNGFVFGSEQRQLRSLIQDLTDRRFRRWKKQYPCQLHLQHRQKPFTHHWCFLFTIIVVVF
ncbi:uncharacterized protein LOC122277592 isoform X11 [Carya illinoinensis]|uniref:uncharacterized protein LOC122277592 isoform X11 n=1 Tax=Carya illinoinensis TaxID=32201 RepID=UPI001C729605|nr:uncharacterized protein LOC122277592 isoform X11 [Carya illinoinensis]